jgi:hypothetical protein
MPIERSADHPTFELGVNHVTSLAAPARGSDEVALFRTDLPPGGGLPPHRHDHFDIFTLVSGIRDHDVEAAFNRKHSRTTLPIAKNDLTSDVQGNISGGTGFADSYYVPLVLGWNKEPASIRILYGFLAPTGRFAPGANDNVGSGYLDADSLVWSDIHFDES